MPFAGTVARAFTKSGSDPAANTEKSRRDHFIRFLNKHSIKDPAMKSFSQEDRNMVMACYAVVLCNDDILVHRTIKCATIDLYLAAAARLSVPSEKLNPTKNRFGQKSEFISAVMREHKRWEQMPNRRSPLTPRMIKTSMKYRTDHPDSLKVALIDWFVLAIYAGPRKSEWCQDASNLRKHQTFAKNIDGSCQAFTLEDLEFFGDGNKKIHIKNINSHNVCAAKIRWRFQKNGDNGQKLTYFRNSEKPDQCPVRAILNIAFRALRLNIDPKGPLAVHATGAKHNTVKYITNVNVEKHLREIAISTYDLTEKEDIQRYTCHSLRVGACVLLHAANSVPETIKVRLRWRSDAYRMYLRDTTQLAHAHNMAVTYADPDAPSYIGAHGPIKTFPEVFKS